jgi:HSP20 family protein
MEEKVRIAAPKRSIWYLSEDPQNTSSEPLRWGICGGQHVWRPPTDLFESDENFTVKVEIAGMQDGEFNISLEDRLLTIRGMRPDSTERRAYYQMEIPYGEFGTEVEVPGPVSTEKIEAIYQDGFLKIVLPKAQPYQIEIKS